MPKSGVIPKRNASAPAAVIEKNVPKRKAISTATKTTKRISIGSAVPPVKSSTAIRLIKMKKAAVDNSPLEWYRLTEITMHVLNAAIVKSDKEILLESNKAQPDQNKINKLELKILEVITIIRDAKNFDSTSRMRQLIEEYGQGRN